MIHRWICMYFIPINTLLDLHLLLITTGSSWHVSAWSFRVARGALSLTDWKLISTHLTFHGHSGPFFIYLSRRHFTLSVLRPHSCTWRQKVDRGQDRVWGVLPNGPLHWTCEPLHLTRPLGTRLACVCRAWMCYWGFCKRSNNLALTCPAVGTFSHLEKKTKLTL